MLLVKAIVLMLALMFAANYINAIINAVTTKHSRTTWSGLVSILLFVVFYYLSNF